jgi:4-hydroxy-tetrahydrodipicolinate reductase
MRSTARVGIVGLGATGIAIADSLLNRDDCAVVGGVDLAAERVGRDLGELVGRPACGVAVISDLADLPDCDVAVIATSSWVESIEPTIAALAERRVNVVSICEELRHPFETRPEASARIDAAARKHGVSVLGTGCNPGMVMDTLALVLSGLTLKVKSVSVSRRADFAKYSANIVKFGLGLTPEEFATRFEAGKVTGHVGFPESIAAIAAGLGWDLDRIEVDPVVPDVIADQARAGDHVEIPAGTIAGVLHQARGVRAGETVIELVTKFGIYADGDDAEPGDRLRIEGIEQTIDVQSPSGYESFLSTIAMACNVVTATIDAEPGLRTISDLPVAAFASKGSHLK